MPIDVTRSAFSAGVGVADEILEYVDAHAKVPRTQSFRTAKDIGRLAIALGGYGLQAFGPGRYVKLGETLALSATPLLVKSLAGPVKRALKIKANLPEYMPTPPLKVGGTHIWQRTEQLVPNLKIG